MMKASAVTKRFGAVSALENVTAFVPNGSIYALAGPNGSGKTTLLKTMAGVYRPDAGEMLVEGEPVWENPQVKGKVFLLPDDLWSPPGCTLLELSRICQAAYPSFDRGEYRRLLTVFPLEEDRWLSRFSKGMRRQAGLILALSCRTPYLLLDEVFDGLDPVIRRRARQLLIQAVEERRLTVVIASHNLRELEDLCDRIGLLYRGRLALERELDELCRSFTKVQGAFPEPVDWAGTGLSILRREERGNLQSLLVRGAPEETLKIVEGLRPLFVEALPLTLEEAFLSEMEVLGYDYAGELSE